MDKRFIKGLFKDTAHIDQPEGTWRYAKNAIINNKTGVLVPLNDPQLTVFAMRELALNTTFRLELGAAGKARARANFDAKSVVKAYDREFCNLIDG